MGAIVVSAAECDWLWLKEHHLVLFQTDCHTRTRYGSREVCCSVQHSKASLAKAHLDLCQAVAVGLQEGLADKGKAAAAAAKQSEVINAALVSPA